MKNILFVIPSIWTAGTNSALSSILSNIDRLHYNIKVFSVTSFGERDLSYKSLLVNKHRVLSAYYADLDKVYGKEKVVVFIVKIIKKVCEKLHVPFLNYIIRDAAKKLSRECPSDTVVGFMEGVATELASKVNAKRRVAWVHCNYNTYLPETKSEEHIYSQFDSIVNVSHFTTDVFKQRYPALSDRCTCIYNLIDERRIVEGAKKSYESISIEKDEFCIISVGRISPVKQFSRIPKIVRGLLDDNCRMKWLIIGPEQDREESLRLKANIKKYEVENEVLCLGMKQNPYPYFRVANLYVCLSVSEACPMVFFEARMLELPILSTDFPSAKEFIIDGEDGMICGIGDIPSNIKLLANDGKLRKKLIKKPDVVSMHNQEIINQLTKIL